MELKDLASISGKGGLFKILKPGKGGMVLEALDESKAKVVVGSNAKMSMLDEISIYTLTKEGTTPLVQVIRKIKNDFEGDPGVDSNSDASELRAFMKSVLPEYDAERVYVSDIKKLLKWYDLIRQFAPEILIESKAESPAEPKG